MKPQIGPQSAQSGAAEEDRLRSDLHAMETRIARQREALLKLTAEPVEDSDRLAQALERIVEVAASALDVRRVSIWQYNQAHTAIVCLDLFDTETGSHTAGQVLADRDYPNYFKALLDNVILAVEDAVTDPMTGEFADAYLLPLGSVSIMDVPIHVKGVVIGVLCHEHSGEHRQWTADETSFAIAVSNLISLAIERSDRQRAESESRLQVAALNAVADATVITNRDGQIVWVNPAFTALTGYTIREAIGRNPRELLESGRHEAAFYDQMWAVLNKGHVWRGEIFNRRKSGEIRVEDQSITPVMTGGQITHFVAINRDLTEKRKLEGQFLQAQKMEVIGRLAGGVAHDFNNMLTLINGTAEMALMDLPKDHPLRVDFENIRQAGTRAAGLTRQLLTFSRKQIVNRVSIDLKTVLTGFMSMLRRLLGEDITLDVRLGEAMCMVMADPGQIEQVVLNLAVNARDAMPKGGHLFVEVCDVVLDEAFAGSHVNVRPGPYVRMSVRDTGEGMAPDVQARIFEPFFTTKETGKGTGLGLATVYAIVEQSGGTILVSSTAGEGTTVTIYLPRMAATNPSSVAPQQPETPARGHETILLVEDEEVLRDLAAAILSSAGYQTLTAGDPLDALQVLATHPTQIDLIVTDVVLPGMDGRQLAAHAMEIAPGTPVLFTSGYTDDRVLALGVLTNTVQFIAKPYTPRSLRMKVREVLDGGKKDAREPDDTRRH